MGLLPDRVQPRLAAGLADAVGSASNNTGPKMFTTEPENVLSWAHAAAPL
jgi:hypothetical protein